MRLLYSLVVVFFLVLNVQAQEIHRHSCQHQKQRLHELSQAGKTMADNSRSDTIDIHHYQINLTIDKDAQTLTGSTKIFFEAKMDNVTEILLDLEALTVDYVFYNDFGTPHTQEGELITVSLFTPLNTGETGTVEVFYGGTPAPAAAFGGFYFSNQYAYNLGVGIGVDPPNYGRAWFPCFDNFVEHSTYEFFITTNMADKAFCNGLLQGVTDNGNGTQTWHWMMNQEIPTYLASVAVAPYETVAYDHQGMEKVIPVQLGALPSHVANMNASFIHLQEAIDAFEQAFGPFQFDRAGYVIVPFFGGAMEHATNIAYPSFAIDGTLEWESLMSHEFAHHWWGDLMTCTTADDMWLNEGWASYCEHIFDEYVYGVQTYKDVVRENHEYVLQYAHHVDGGAFPLNPVPFDVTYGSHSYDKGADVARTLRGYLGDELFFQCTKDFLNAHAFGNASSADFRDFLTQCSGEDMAPFFDGWVFNAGFPHFSIDSIVIESAGVDLFEGSVYVRQRLFNAPEFFDAVPLDIRFFDTDLEQHDYSIEVSGACTKVDFSLPFYPLYAFLDLDEKIGDATTDEYVLATEVSEYIFPETKASVTINSLDGDVFIRAEHNWVMPDRFQNPDNFSGVILSDNRYWKIDLIGEGLILAEAELEYNGSSNTNGGYLDHNLISTNENDLRLYYRPSPAQDWAEASGYSINTQGTANDKRGTIELSNLISGEYTLGIYDPNRTDDLETFIPNSCESFELSTSIIEIENADNRWFDIYPNPANDFVEIELAYSNEIASIRLFDTKGALVGSWAPNDIITNWTLDVQAFDAGLYLLELVDENGLEQRRKLVIE